MWNEVILQSNLIQGETDKALLIKLPKSEFKFWFPKKLTRYSGKNYYLVNLSVKDDMQFNIFRTGKGRYNKTDKLEEKTISYQEFLNMINN